jgi:hypothetical protein
MKTTKLIILILTIVLASGCSSFDQDLSNWSNVKKSQDFVEFFKFSLNTSDSILLSFSIDSLEKYKPKKKCILLCYSHYYSKSSDSLIFDDFKLEDRCEIHYDYKKRNIFRIKISPNEAISAEYQYEKLNNYHDEILSLYLSDTSSYELPELLSVYENGKEYFSRTIGILIYSNLLENSTYQKNKWLRLINELHKIFGTISKAKELKSQEIFNESYNNLSKERIELIDKLIPIHIIIHFYELAEIPPPPPPLVEIDLTEN